MFRLHDDDVTSVLIGDAWYEVVKGSFASGDDVRDDAFWRVPVAQPHGQPPESRAMSAPLERIVAVQGA